LHPDGFGVREQYLQSFGISSIVVTEKRRTSQVCPRRAESRTPVGVDEDDHQGQRTIYGDRAHGVDVRERPGGRTERACIS
jgi:hypothetical protein